MLTRFWNGARARRTTLTLAGVAALALVATGCASSDGGQPDAPGGEALFSQELHDLLPEAIQDAGVLSFGGLWETPPILSVDEADPTKPAGIAPELAAKLGEVLGVDVEWQNLAWPAQLPGLQSGSVDVLFGQVSVTEEREQSVVDLVPFQKRSYGLLVADGNPKKISRLADLCDLTIAVPIGSNQSKRIAAINESDCVGAGKPAITMNEYQGASAAIQALRGGTVDAWIDTYPNIADVVSTQDDAFDGFALPTDEVPTEYSGIAVSKDNPGLTEALAGAMRLLVENGAYAAAYDGVELGTDDFTIDEIVINPLTGTPAGEMAQG